MGKRLKILSGEYQNYRQFSPFNNWSTQHLGIRQLAGLQKQLEEMLTRYEKLRDFPYIALDLSEFQTIDQKIFEFLANEAAKLKESKIGDLVVFDLPKSAEEHLAQHEEIRLTCISSETVGLKEK